MDKFGLKEMIHSIATAAAAPSTVPSDLKTPAPPAANEVASALKTTSTKPTAAGPKKVASKASFPSRPGTSKASAAPKESQAQAAAYSRHTKSSLAHQRKIPLQKPVPEPEPKKAASLAPPLSKPKPKSEIQRRTEPALEGGQGNIGGGAETAVFKAVTEDLIRENNIENVALKLKIPEKAVSSEERELKRCTFKPSLSRVPPKYQNVKPRLLEHFEASDSISEEAELAYELKQEMKKRRMVEWQNRSCDGIMSGLVPSMATSTLAAEESVSMANRPLSPIVSKGFSIFFIF